MVNVIAAFPFQKNKAHHKEMKLVSICHDQLLHNSTSGFKECITYIVEQKNYC